MELMTFGQYKEAKGICVRPLSHDNLELGYFNHCEEMPQRVSNKKVEGEFFSGRGRFYNYDIKLDPNVEFSKYQKFITEFLRRGETHDCLIHFSNNVYDYQRDKDIVSIYNMPHILQFVEVTTAIPQTIYFELDDKRFEPTPLRELTEIDKWCRKLESIPNILKFLLNESIHKRGTNNDLSNTSTTLASYDLYYKVQMAKEEEKMMQKINMKQSREY